MRLIIKDGNLYDCLNPYQKKLIRNKMQFKITKKLKDEDGMCIGENCQYIEAASREEAQAEYLKGLDIEVSEVNN